MVVLEQNPGLHRLMPALNFAVSYGNLLVYKTISALPLPAILMIASSRSGLNRMARWNLHHRDGVKLVLGGVVALGLAILAIA